MKGKVVGTVVIDKSFDEDIKVLTKKSLEDGDLEDVLQKEGQYLDDLVRKGFFRGRVFRNLHGRSESRVNARKGGNATDGGHKSARERRMA